MSDRSIAVGLAYMYEPAFNRAVLPLLETGAVDALEWSFDTVRDPALLPDWQQSLLQAYAREDRLYGHGVYYSLLNAASTGRQTDWLRRLEAVQQRFPFRHLSEHFGFMSTRNAHSGCPLPMPLTPAALELGRRRLAALHRVAGCPLGIENLALAFSREDVLAHGSFLEQLVAPVGGFIVLDLHNIYCQAHNFGVDLQELIQSYPLERVREVHVSGGSWAQGADSGRDIRRDTHDDRIPQAVLDALPFAIARCPNLDLVILERLGDTIMDERDEAHFRREFLQVKALVHEASAGRTVPGWPFQPMPAEAFPEPVTESTLCRQQQSVLEVLAGAKTAREAKSLLLADDSLADWKIGTWDPEMIETAIQLGRKWGIDVL